MPEDRPHVLWPLVAALVLAFLGGVVAIRAARAAATFHERLNQRRPALGMARPWLAERAPAARSRRVVVVILDGLRLDASFGHPWLDGLRRLGAEGIGHAGFPTYSRPNHVAVVTGVPPVASGVRFNSYDGPVSLDSLMDRAAAAGLTSAYVADSSFAVADMFRYDFEATHFVPWSGGLERALRLVIRQGYPLVVVIPGAIDDTGHERGAGSREYAAAVTEVDSVMASALAGLDLARDTLIVTADHGHLDVGGHGGMEREIVEVPVILAGAGIRRGAALGDVDLVDLAPTAAALLGLPAPGHGLGRTLTTALDLPAEERLAVERADAIRRGRNRSILRTADEAAVVRAGAIRIERLAWVGVGAIVAALALLIARRLRAIQLDVRVLGIGLPAFPLTYYVLLDLIGRYSLSTVPDRPDALTRLVDYALVATAVQVVASWVALHGRSVLRERLAAAVGLSLCALLVSWLPAGVLWALFDPESQPILAGSRTQVVVPATWVAVAFVAMASAVTLAIEIIVFIARGTDPSVRLRKLERATERVLAEMQRAGSGAQPVVDQHDAADTHIDAHRRHE